MAGILPLDMQLGQNPQGLAWGSYPTRASLGYENLPNFTMPNLNGTMWGGDVRAFDMSGAPNPAQLQNQLRYMSAGAAQPDLAPPGGPYRWVKDPELQQWTENDVQRDGDNYSITGWDPDAGSITPQMQAMMRPGMGGGILPGQAQLGPAPGNTYPILAALARLFGGQ